MSADWIDLQFRLQPLWSKYFQDRSIPGERLAQIARHSTQEEQQAVDAVVRAISRGSNHRPLSEREADLFALRLHWAWFWVAAHLRESADEGADVDDEEAIERLLIEHWRAGGGAHYQFLFAKMGLGS